VSNLSPLPLTNGLAAIQPITDEEFGRFQRLIHDLTGISMCPAKKMLVASRLQHRLAHHGLNRYGDYYQRVISDHHPDEKQVLVDVLTTNETYFFREPDHFTLLRDRVLPAAATAPFRVWSAACSSGEEVYSLAMVLDAQLAAGSWELLGSDVSRRVLQQAERGHYPMARNEGINAERLRRYCLKGVRRHAGTFLIDERLKRSVRFRQINLKQPLPSLGRFDVIFLRNVLIYFDQATKKQIVQRVIEPLKKGGYLFISHTENLHGIVSELEMIKPSIFIKR
jgi:chemotaxis protein methyltransferase CheR